MGNVQVVEYEDPGGDSSTVLWVGDHVLSVYLQQGAALACPSGNLGMTLPQAVQGKSCYSSVYLWTRVMCGHIPAMGFPFLVA